MNNVISTKTQPKSLMARILSPLANYFAAKADSKPYFDIYDKASGELYMRRGWVSSEPFFLLKLLGFDYKARIHSIHRSDKERALHCHPWNNISFILRGGYWEVTPKDPKRYEQWLKANTLNPQDHLKANLLLKEDSELFFEDLLLLKAVWRGPGSLVFRKAHHRHRLIVPDGQSCLSLFITFKKIKPWGFYSQRGFTYWREYLDEWEGMSESEGFKKETSTEVLK